MTMMIHAPLNARPPRSITIQEPSAYELQCILESEAQLNCDFCGKRIRVGEAESVHIPNWYDPEDGCTLTGCQECAEHRTW